MKRSLLLPEQKHSAYNTPYRNTLFHLSFPSYRYTCLKYSSLPLYNDNLYVRFLIHCNARNAYFLHYKSSDILFRQYLQTRSYLKVYPQAMHYHPDNKMRFYFP